jgi:hypothetical protein
MNSKQVTVMWLGLLLIAARLFTTGQWSDLWSTFGSQAKAAAPANSGSSNPASGAPNAPGSPAQPPLMSPTGGKPLLWLRKQSLIRVRRFLLSGWN